MTCAAARYISSLALTAALLTSAALTFAQAPAAPPPAAPRPAPAPRVAPAPAPAPAAPSPVTPAPVAPAPVAPPPVTPAPAAAPAPAPAAAPAPAPAPAPAAAPESVPPLAPTPEAAPAAVGPVAEPPPLPVPALPAEDIPWYESITFAAFADGYFGLDFNFPKSPGQARVNPIRAYDARSGFALNWAGLDIQKAPEPVGGVIALRFGPAAQRLAEACVDSDNCDSSVGLSFVKQAFGSWKPGGAGSAVTLDLGKFDTPYGAEVAESQYNINYTRGVLYWLGQPAYHTGLRVGIDASRNFNLKLLAVNGWNRTIDNNSGKTFGLQGTLRVPKSAAPDEDMLSVALGYMVGPEHGDSARIDCPAGTSFDPDTNPDTGCVPDAASAGDSGIVDRGSSNTKGLRHFLDLTLVAQPVDAFKLLFNASLGIDNDRDPAAAGSFVSKSWYGLMAGARYAVAEPFGIAGRVEYYADPDGYTTGNAISFGKDLRYVTGTLTLDYSPSEKLIVFLDGRLDWSTKQAFPKGARDHDVGSAVSATLGAIVTTN